MNAMRIAGILLVLLGIAGFFTGGFSYTSNDTKAQLGPLKLQVQEQKSIDFPQWLSLGAIVLGGVLLAVSFRRP